jgi:hypothetical protein
MNIATMNIVSESVTQVQPGRCIICGKKVKIHTIECKCKENLCWKHVEPNAHNCIFDYKTLGKKLIEEQNPKIATDKIKS